MSDWNTTEPPKDGEFLARFLGETIMAPASNRAA
jgi:hypothetical protein